MTLSSSNNPDEEAAGSSSHSASTASTEVLTLPLGTQGEVFLDSDDKQLVTLFQDAVQRPPGSIVMVNSDGGMVGNVVNVKVEGPTNFMIKNINGNEKGQVTGSGTAKPVPKRLKDFLMDRPTQFWLAGLLLAIIVIASLVLTFCLYNYTGGNNSPAFGHNDNLGDDIQIIQREEWLAQPPLIVTKIDHPLRMVRIMHTAGTFCSTYQSCASKVLALQGWQVATMGMPDIAYNFLIGGDGNVYVGRGAGVENQWQKNAIDIGYIGNFLSVYDKMTNKMEEAGKRLIVRLYEQNYLTSDYFVVAQNQTTNTQSPGDNIFKKIVTWPHYDSGLYFD